MATNGIIQTKPAQSPFISRGLDFRRCRRQDFGDVKYAGRETIVGWSGNMTVLRLENQIPCKQPPDPAFALFGHS